MKITTGKIIAVHGIKGEVRVKPLTDNPRRYRRGSELYIEKEQRSAVVLAVREGKDGTLILRLQSITDRNQAEALKGSLLQVEEEKAPALPQGEYYYFQLEGMSVFEEDGTFLGKITEVIANGANDVYKIAAENGENLLLPGLKQVVRNVDVEKREMTVALLPGLKEACTYHEN